MFAQIAPATIAFTNPNLCYKMTIIWENIYFTEANKLDRVNKNHFSLYLENDCFCYFFLRYNFDLKYKLNNFHIGTTTKKSENVVCITTTEYQICRQKISLKRNAGPVSNPATVQHEKIIYDYECTINCRIHCRYLKDIAKSVPKISRIDRDDENPVK